MKILSEKLVGDRLEILGLLLLLLYLLAGLIYSALVPPVARFPDEQDYLKLSGNLLHGPGFSLDGIHLTASRPPGYAFFLAAVGVLGSGFFSFRAAQFILFVATIILASRLCTAQKMFAGLLITTGLVICYPVLFYTSATLYPQTLAAFLFIIATTMSLASPRGLVLNLAAGLFFGVLILVVPTFLFTTAIVLGGARLLKIICWRDVLLMGLACSIIVGSWTWRNAVCFQQFVPVATNSGLNLLEGNNPQAKAYEAAANRGMETYYQTTEKLGLNEFQSDRFYRQEALIWIKAHPGQALVLYLEKVLNFFNIVNVYSPQIQEEVSPGKQIVMALSYLLLIGLMVWRLIESRDFPFSAREKLLLAVYVLSAFTSAIFFTRIRHRLPYDYLIIAIIASHLSRRLEIGLGVAGSSHASSKSDISSMTKR